MRTTALTALIVAALATAGTSAEKPRKPRLDLRAAPRMAFSPVNVLLTAELTGGDDVDEYYCPEIEWNWDDGGKSVHEADCAPLEAGGTLRAALHRPPRLPAGRDLQREDHDAQGQPHRSRWPRRRSRCTPARATWRPPARD